MNRVPGVTVPIDTAPSPQAICEALGAGGSSRSVIAAGARLDRAPLVTALDVLGATGADDGDVGAGFAALHALVPDLRIDLVRAWPEDDRIAMFVRLHGTVGGDPVQVGGVVVAWIRDGEVGRVWALADELRFLLQLRAVRLPAAVPAADRPDPAGLPWRHEPTSDEPPDRLREVARLLVEGVVSTGDAGLAASVLTEDLVFSRAGLGTAFSALALAAPDPPRGGADFAGLAGFRHGLAAIRSAFPDWRQVVGDGQTCARDVVVSPIRVTGRQSGALFGHPASGLVVDFDEVLMMRMAGDRIADIWAMGDEAAFLRALGALET